VHLAPGPDQDTAEVGLSVDAEHRGGLEPFEVAGNDTGWIPGRLTSTIQMVKNRPIPAGVPSHSAYIAYPARL